MQLTVYSKTNCPQCDQAKHLLKTLELPFEEVKIDTDLTAREFLLQEGHRSVPQIYQGNSLFVQNGFQGLKAKFNR